MKRTQSLDQLFARDPLSFKKREIATIIAHIRRSRSFWETSTQRKRSAKAKRIERLTAQLLKELLS